MSQKPEMMLDGANAMNMTVLHSMPMAFTMAHDTPLYSMAWKPTTHSAYAATCLFLIVLALISRLLQAYRNSLEHRWHERDAKRRYMLVGGSGSAQREKRFDEDDEASLPLPSRGGAADRPRFPRVGGNTVQSQPWRFSTDLPRACVFVVQAGVGYLLMLAVMTLNVGYFLSVLAGLFVGELAVGRYAGGVDSSH